MTYKSGLRALMGGAFALSTFVAGNAHAQSYEADETLSETTEESDVQDSGERNSRRERRVRRARAERAPAQSELEPRLTFDLGASVGSYGDLNYTEANLGLNLYFYRWLAWRNAAFYRFVEEIDDIYGLDSSVRGIFNADGGAVGLTAFAGPGYRFVNEGKNVPFGETGAVIRLGGFAIGGGVKAFWNEAVDDNLENDTQYFIILSGAGSL